MAFNRAPSKSPTMRQMNIRRKRRLNRLVGNMMVAEATMIIALIRQLDQETSGLLPKKRREVLVNTHDELIRRSRYLPRDSDFSWVHRSTEQPVLRVI